MGNAHGHGERRKSKGITPDWFQSSFNHSSDGQGNSFDPINIGPPATGAGSVRRHSGSGGSALLQRHDGLPVGIDVVKDMEKFGPYRPRATTEGAKTHYAVKNRHRSQDIPELSNMSAEQPKTGFTSHSVGDKHNHARIRRDSEREQGVQPTIFKFNGANAKEVYVSGSFNNWQKLKMSKSTKDFVAIVPLDEGEHEYRFFVDGQWTNDPSTDVVEKNGKKHNVIKVQKEDFDAFDALNMDSEEVSKKNKKSVEAYGQEAPTFGGMNYRGGPPILPPHLLQVILNKDTPLSYEPTLLPEPNHVMINHLYALSIKDGVMVLSSTQRFRKKYVTTLLYKPMEGKKH